MSLEVLQFPDCSGFVFDVLFRDTGKRTNNLPRELLRLVSRYIIMNHFTRAFVEYLNTGVSFSTLIKRCGYLMNFAKSSHSHLPLVFECVLLPCNPPECAHTCCGCGYESYRGVVFEYGTEVGRLGLLRSL
jgi:hypothetical protein